MTPHTQIPLVSTIGERCRVCYQCVRECPAKAIRIADRRAQVLPERCIGCGVCVKVCTQDAKRVLSAVEAVDGLLAGAAPVAAILAPSFPAEFIGYDYRQVVGGLRQMGFVSVHEVAFGAELVAMQYQRLVAENADRLWIATTCPSVVGYVRRYAPGLVESLAPIVSPMIAAARLLRELHGDAIRIVFIGPCIAKKREAVSAELEGEVDEVLTFAEARAMLAARGVDLDTVAPVEFDPPHARGGGLFPISGGMLQVAGIQEDLVTGHVMVGEGPSEFQQAIKEAETGIMETRLLELLFCKGCTMGPGMSSDLPHFGRRARVSQFVRQRIGSVAAADWAGAHRRWADLDLTRRYAPMDLRLPVPSPEELGRILGRLGKTDPQHELNCGACGYSSCRELASAIYVGLAEPTMCLPFSIEQLRSTVSQLAQSHEELANAQEALVRSEKLASMGQLAAGIAHEVNNPLGVVIMYAHFLMEQLGSQREYRDDLTMVVEQADRCKKIVAGLLDFARQNKVEHDRVNIAELVQKAMRGVPPPVNVSLEVESLLEDPMVEVDPDQVTQVVINLVSNAYAAMPDGGMLRVATSGAGDRFALTVSDTGVGIPPEHFPKLFEPFFTTKKGGKGTGLGLAVTYGIVKMHRGDIKVTSNTDPAKGPAGTTFTVALPRRRQDAAPAAELLH
jgi:signal transduction histidine kinase/Pyruvate/2-oxoacid:ferredoxin oxidoreductase delta subunit